jgi:hypothetical protein
MPHIYHKIIINMIIKYLGHGCFFSEITGKIKRADLFE